MTGAGSTLADGLLLPPATIQTGWFAVLAAFVAINTVMYSALALAKMLPKVYLSDLLRRRNRRSDTRSIHPGQPPGE